MAWCGWKAWYPILSQGGLQLPWAVVLTMSLGSSCPCQSSCSSVLPSVELSRHPIKVNSRAPPPLLGRCCSRQTPAPVLEEAVGLDSHTLALRPGLPLLRIMTLCFDHPGIKC